MAINESQKVDWLWKKLGYGVAKTDINSIKAATNESIASPLLIRGDNIWQDSAAIPGTKPTSSSTVVKIYDDSGNGSATVECTADATATPNRTWNTNSTDWISAEFGSTYLIKVYLDNAGAATPQTTGTQLFAAGSGNNDEWYFDFQSGVLNFIGDNLPSGINGKKIYVVGARYIGNKGTNLSSANIGNFTFNNNTMGVSNANGDIILDPDGTGKLSVLADNVTITGDGALTLPVGTTAGRPTPNAQGMIRYNTTDSTFEGYDGANWGSLGGVKDVDQDTYILAESSAGADNDELDFYTAGVQRAQIGATGDIKFGNTLAEFTIAGASGDVETAGALIVGGNLQVNGSFTTVNSTTVTIDDPIFTLGGDTAPTLDDNKDRGIEFRYFDTTAKIGFFGYDDNANVFTFIPDATNTNEVFSGTAGDVVFGEGTFTGLTGGNITIGVTDDNTIDTSSGNLTINSTGGTTNITDNTDITGTLGVSSTATFAGTVEANNGITVDSTKFIVANGTGNVTTAGTLTVSGLASLDGGIDMDGVFTVADTSGNITTTGTLDTGNATLDTATVSDLTDTQIVVAGTAGRLEGNGNLTFNGATFEVGTSFSVVSATGNTSISGLLDVTGEATLGSAIVSDLTDNRVVIAGTNGALEDDANFTFDGSALTLVADGTVTGQWNVDNLRLDGNSISSTDTDGNINITPNGTGEVIASTLTVSDLIDNRIVIAGTNGSLEDDINFTFDGTTFEVGTQFDVDVSTGNTNIAGTLDVTSTSTLGVLDAGESTLSSVTISDLTSGRITLAGTAGALEDSANLTFDGTTLALTGAQTISTTLNVSGLSTLATARVSDLVDNNVVIAGVDGRLESNSNFTFNGTTLAVTGAATISTTLGVSGESTLASATVSDLTDNRIVIAGTNGSLEDDANLTFDGTTFEVGTKFDVDVSTGNTTLAGTLDVTGEVTLASATVSDLTDNRIVIAGTNGALEDDANFTFDGTILTVDGNQSLTGSLNVDSGATISSAIIEDLTDNRVVIAGTGGELEDDANFTFDGATLTLVANADITGDLDVDNININGNTLSSTDTDGNINITPNGTGEVVISTATVSDLTDNRIVIAGTSGSLGDDANLTFDGTTFEVGTKFDVDAATGNTNIDGTLGVTGEATLASAIVSDLTDNRIIIAGTNGALEDDVNFTFNGTQLAVGVTNFTVAQATGNTSISGTLDVTGDSTLDVLQAGESTLASATVSDLTSGRVTLAGTAGALEDSANLIFNGTTLTVTGNVNVTTEATLASAIVSDLTDNRIVIAGTAGALEDDANFRFDGANFQIGASGSEVLDVDVATGNTDISGTLTVGGNLQVNGLVTTVNSTTVTIDDPVFTLGGDTAPTVDDNKDRGIEFRYFDTTAKVGFFGFDDSSGKFTFIPDATNTSEVFSGATGELDAKVDWNNLLNVPSTATATDFGIITVTDTDTGYSWSETGSIVADVTSDTLTLVSGTYINIDADATSDAVRIKHIDTTRTDTTSTSSPAYNGTFDIVSSVSSNTQGHITAVNVETVTLPNDTIYSISTEAGADNVSEKIRLTDSIGNTDDIILAVAQTGTTDGLVISEATDTITFAHADTSTISGTKGTAGIQSITIDEMGHVTAVTPATFDNFVSWTLTGDSGTSQTIESGDTVDIAGGTYISTVAGATDTITVNHDPTTRTDTTSTQSPAFNDTVDIVSSITSNTQGHITAVNVNTITMPVESDTLDTVTGRGSTTTNDISVNTLTSTVVTGTAPLTVTSTTLVNNLNADLLDGEEGTYYLDWTNTTNKPDPVITLGGDLSGSVTLTDLTSGTLTATINANSVELGTDTTGDYVSSLVAGTGVTLTNNTGETATPTIAIGQEVETTSDVTFNSITGPLTGNADTASKWANPRTVTFATGDVTGSFSIDGSANVSDVALTIGANSVALGTDTTGNYVATIAGTANEIEVTGSGAETAAITVGLPNDVTISNDLTVGNLTDNRIVIAGTSGILEDDANFTFDGTTFEVGTKFDVEVSTGNTDIIGTLDVTSNTDLAANVTLGTTSADSIFINGLVASNIIPLTPDANDLGSSTNGWRDLYLTESVNFIGATSENEIVIPTNLGDGLSIKDTAGDLIVFKTTTSGQKITITPDLQLAGNFTINSGSSVTTILDEDTLVSDSDTALATQQSIKAYVDNKNSTQDLDIAGDTGTGSITLDSQTFTISGTAKEIETAASGQSITIGLPNDVTVGNDLTVTNDLTVSGSALITGDLTINGTTTTVNTTELAVTDNLITLNDGETGAGVTAGTAGIEIDRGTADNKNWIWDEATDRWSAGSEDIQAGQFYGTIDGGTF